MGLDEGVTTGQWQTVNNSDPDLVSVRMCCSVMLACALCIILLLHLTTAVCLHISLLIGDTTVLDMDRTHYKVN